MTQTIKSDITKEISFQNIKSRYLEGYNNQVLYLAVNTSTILVNKKHFLTIKGYDQQYIGHGYEDFELLHKLYCHYPIVKRDESYILDYKTNFPYQYQGFRKIYAYYALENFFNNTYTLHLWHPRPLTSKYYRQRETNASYFLKHLTQSMQQTLTLKYIDSSLPQEFTLYLEKLLKKHKLDKKNSMGLKMRHPKNIIYKNQDSFKRKFRKLRLHPIQFFLDIRKKMGE